MKEHCSKCGKVCMVEPSERSNKSSHTGETLFTLKVACPDARWYNQHTSYESPHSYTAEEVGSIKADDNYVIIF